MEAVIGIISYFPDSPVRQARYANFLTLINKCNTYLNLPILVIAQNYTESEISEISSQNNVTLLHYPKLGIVGARKELRKQFLESEYDYLIMLDDDCLIRGTPKDGRDYLQTIQEHPEG